MRVRHKQPTLVSMWMLDVFCCALGCVTLLFLLNSRMAGDEAEKNRAALIDLAESRKKLTTALTDLESVKLRLNSEVQQLTTQLGAVRTEKADLARRLGIARDEAKSVQELLDATKTALNAAESKLDVTAKELATATIKAADADDLLRKRQKEADILAKRLSDAVTASDELARLLRKKDDERAVMVKQAADMQKMLDDLDARLLASRKDLDATSAAAKAAAAKAADELAMARKAGGDDIAAARGQVKDLLKKIDEANATIIDLQGDKARLADKYDRFQKDIEARFAGIVTSGKRVVFVVDISGSMAKKDAEHADPTKWPIVVETVGKVMRSIVGLEQYQVVVFSSSSRWLFGGGAWQDYTAKSVDDVTNALLHVKPYDDTNLYCGARTGLQAPRQRSRRGLPLLGRPADLRPRPHLRAAERRPEGDRAIRDPRQAPAADAGSGLEPPPGRQAR